MTRPAARPAYGGNCAAGAFVSHDRQVRVQLRD